jgi:hypothetical protein
MPRIRKLNAYFDHGNVHMCRNQCQYSPLSLCQSERDLRLYGNLVFETFVLQRLHVF